MNLPDPNLIEIFAAAVVSIVFGMLWYGPFMGRAWMKHAGMKIKDVEKAKREGMGKEISIAFVSALTTAFFLSSLAEMLSLSTVLDGVELGAFVWLGFVSTSQIIHFVYEERSLVLYRIHMGYHLFEFILMGAVILLI